MKVVYNTKDGSYSFEVEGKTHTDVVEQLASLQELFVRDMTCTVGKESSDKVVFVVREVDGNKFYEKVVYDGPLKGYKLSMGQHKKGGTLFAKKKGEDDKWLDNGGWQRYNSKTGKME